MIDLYDSFSPPGNLGDIPAPSMAPDSVSFLGSVPRGFFEIGTLDECSDSSPAFLRGLLMPRLEYEALPMTAPIGKPSKTSMHLPPRWALYGGPLPTRAIAREWDSYMHFWSQQQGLVWVHFPDGTPCIVASHRIPWPNSGFAWTWVREIEYPRRVVRDKSSIHIKYVWEAPGQ